MDEKDDNSVAASDTEDEDSNYDPPTIKKNVPPKKDTEEGEVEEDDEEEDNETVDSNVKSENSSEYGSQDEESDADEENAGIAATEGVLKKPAFLNTMNDSDDDDNDDEEEDNENYLQKFDDSIKQNIIAEYHPELQMHNNDEIDIMSRVVRNENGVIIDPFHKTVPFITRYEKARIIGERAKQIECGAALMIDVEATLIDGYLIALKEFEAKKIPFIIKRPLPSGGCEYWKLSDLEYL